MNIHPRNSFSTGSIDNIFSNTTTNRHSDNSFTISDNIDNSGDEHTNDNISDKNKNKTIASMTGTNNNSVVSDDVLTTTVYTATNDNNVNKTTTTSTSTSSPYTTVNRVSSSPLDFDKSYDSLIVITKNRCFTVE